MSREYEADNAAKAMTRIILAVLVGAAGAAFLIICISSTDSFRERGRRPVQGELDLDESRRLAIDWATPECGPEVEAAVGNAITPEQVVDAAWRACPNHPDAYE